jgi:hypothetical protein
MKKLCPALLIITLFAFSCKNHAQSYFTASSIDTTVPPLADTTKPHFDALPDSAELAYFNSLPEVKPNDTAFSHLVLRINGEKVHFTDYVASQAYRGYSPNQSAFARLAKPSASLLRLARLPQKTTILSDFFVAVEERARALCGPQKFADNSPGIPNKPQQATIAYSWGWKTYDKRTKPLDQCTYEIYGLDCSGYFYQIFLPFKIDFMKYGADADDERRSIGPTLQPHFPTIHIAVTNHFGQSDFQAGDIVYFYNQKKKKATHIGIVLESDDGTTSFYATSKGDTCSHDDDCCKNNLVHGPHILPLPKQADNSRILGYVRVSTQ